MLQDYLGRGLIRPSISPWASPIVLVPKRDGSLRFCVDYRGLNSVTTKDAFPLPNIDQILLNLNGKKFFSTLDFHSGYWQIKMDRSSIEKTAFLTEFGLHEFVVMPFGLSNAVATFQRFMSRLFEDFINKFIFVYIDDILIASTTFEEHCEHLRLVFEKIREAELKLRIEKCKFAANELAFLGHILTQEGVKMDADKYKPIIELPIPNTKKRLHSFLGFAAYYRKFIYNFATITAPLFHLIKEGTPFKMGEKEIKIVEFLKEKIREDVLLYFPDFEAALKNLNRPFIIFTDASKTGISAILCQPDTEKRIRPIYFASRQCNKHESRYCATELEALAVRFGAKKFSQFIIGIPTRVITDHKALVPMFRKKDETGNARVDRWLMELNARFQLTVEYQPGKTNTVADFLSRTYSEEYSWGEKEIEEKSLDPPPILSKTHKIVGLLTEREEKEIWVEATKQSELKEVYEFLKERRLPNELREKQKLLDNLHKYSLIEELLYLCEEKTQNLRLFVPQKFRKKFIEERHSGNCAGHLSAKKIYKQLSQKYFWPNMFGNCVQNVMRCRICAHSRKPRANEPPLQTVKTSEPLELVCLDILSIGPSDSGNKYILVMIDHFSKYIVASPIPDKSAETIAKLFIKEFVLILGAPKKIHSDKGKEFVNEILNEIAVTLKIEKTITSGYDPQANGITERANQTILGMLRRTTATHWSWDQRLPFIIFCYNTTPSEVTGYSPFQIIFGKSANFPEDPKFAVNPNYTVDENTYIQLFRENLLSMLEEARKNSEISREKTKRLYDARPTVTKNKFQKGERAMVIFPGTNARSQHKKLSWNSFGPFKIVEITESSAKVIPTDKPNAEPITVPVERLVRVPCAVPNISTLHKGKNAYKNVLNLMLLAEALGREKTENLNKNQNLIFQLRTIDFLESEDVPVNKETESTNKIEWTTACEGEKHDLCQTLHCSDLDPVLDSSSELGSTVIRTPLQALLTTFLLLSDQTSSSSAAKELVKQILKEEPGQEIEVYERGRKDYVKGGAFPKENDAEKIWKIWVERCSELRQQMQKSGFNAIELEAPKEVENLKEGEKEGWQNLFATAPWILEKVRAQSMHNATKFITTPRAIIGDSSAKQLVDRMPLTHFIGTEKGPISHIIRELSSCVFSSKVKAAIIFLGRDSLLSSETVDLIMEQCERVQKICCRFTHIKWIWIPPPFIRQHSEQYQALLSRLRQQLGELFVCVTPSGRSLVELWRYGNSFDSTRVSADGWMTEEGLTALNAWIKTQITTWPGDRELGHKAIRSVVNRSVERPRLGRDDRLVRNEEVGGNRRSRLGRDDRLVSSRSDHRPARPYSRERWNRHR
ncbi:hypothetical protein ACQ4LE_002964 [Meloidogyne hapla]